MPNFDPSKAGMASDGDYSMNLFEATNVYDSENKLENFLNGKSITKDPSDQYAGRLMEEFYVYRSARTTHDDDMVDMLRNYHGQYNEAKVNIKRNGSRAFVKLTKTKVKLASSLLSQIVLAPDSWCMEAPHNPNVPWLKKQLLQNGVKSDDIPHEVAKRAALSAERLEAKVRGCLEENDIEDLYNNGILSDALFGKAVFAGPWVVQVGSEQDEENTESGVLNFLKKLIKRTDMDKLHSMGLEDKYKFRVEHVRHWDVYWDPVAESVQDCYSIWRRRVITRTQFIDLMHSPGFDETKMKKILEDCPDGNWTILPWESSIAQIDMRNTQLGKGPQGRFEVYERWGKVTGRDLKNSGMDISEDMLDQQTMVQIWICNSKIIRCESSELHDERLPYYIAQWDKIPGTMHAEGVAESMKDAQATINAAEREKNNNMAAISQPTQIIRPDRLKMRDSVLAYKPGATYVAKEGDDSQGGKPIEFLEVPNHLESFLKVQEHAKHWADEETSLPSFLGGEQGAGVHNRTLGGAALQFSNSMAPMRAVAMNWEKQITIPMLQAIARAYSMYSNDPTIKCGARVSAKGVNRMIAREMFLQKFDHALQAISGIPGLADRLDEEALGNAIFREMGLDHDTFFLGDSEYEAKMQKKMQQQAQQAAMQQEAQDPQKLRAETARKDAALELALQYKDTVMAPVLLEETMQMQAMITPEAEQFLAIFKGESMKKHQDGMATPTDIPENPNHVKHIKKVKVNRDAEGKLQSAEIHEEHQTSPDMNAMPPQLMPPMPGAGQQG